MFQIVDPYLNPPKTWQFCHPLKQLFKENTNHGRNSFSAFERQKQSISSLHMSKGTNNAVILQSYLNIFMIRQVTISTSFDSNKNPSILSFNVPIKAVKDPDVLQKVIAYYQLCSLTHRFLFNSPIIFNYFL